MTNLRIRFEPFREEHLPLLRLWLREPHVKEFWQEDEAHLHEKFPRGLIARGVTPSVLVVDGKPTGYIQHYEARKIGGGWWPRMKAGVFGIDQFLGDPGLLGKGLGTRVIRAYCENLFRDSAVLEIIADPDPANARAIRAYEKAGFARGDRVVTPGGEAILMRATRESFAAHARMDPGGSGASR